MTLRQLLVLSSEFEAMADMMARLAALETGEDDILRDRLNEIQTSLTVTRDYMRDTAVNRLQRQQPA